jgi:hypothetical protein
MGRCGQVGISRFCLKLKRSSVLGLLGCGTCFDNRTSNYFLHTRDAGKSDLELIYTRLVGERVSFTLLVSSGSISEILT